MSTRTRPSRRELNKARTRQAIRVAVLDLAMRRPLAEITAEEIAELAQVSRRTFFNYYAGLDAVLAEATREPMSGIAEAFLARPPSEDPLTAIIAALGESLPVELARWCVALGRPETQRSEVHSQVWHRHTDWLGGVLRQRVGREADAIFVAGLAGSVMAVFDATAQIWLERSQGRLDEPSLALFGELLRQGLTHARDGWRAPTPTGAG